MSTTRPVTSTPSGQEAPHELLGVVGHHAHPVGSDGRGQRGQHLGLGHQRSPGVAPRGGPRPTGRPGRTARPPAPAPRSGDRPGSPAHRGARARMPVPARAPATSSSSAATAEDTEVGTVQSGATSHSGSPAGPVGAPSSAGRPSGASPSAGAPRSPSRIADSNRLHAPFISSRAKADRAASWCQPPRTRSSTSTSSGTSRTSGIISAFVRTRPACSARFWRSLGDRASRLA